MKIDVKTRLLLISYGFMWHKDGSTDRVDADVIQDIIPAADGFTVIYKKKPGIVLELTTATVESIEMPAPEELIGRWIVVNWKTAVDQRRD